MGSFCERSLRFCEPKEWYVPEALRAQAWAEPGETTCFDVVDANLLHESNVYSSLVSHGIKREQARIVLGTAFYTEFLWTVNTWSLVNYLRKRLGKSAQWEHREYASAVLKLFHQAMPITSEAFFHEELLCPSSSSQRTQT